MNRRVSIVSLAALLSVVAPACSGGSFDDESVESMTQALGNLTISGRITTSSGAAVAGATVTLSGSAQGTRTTDANGAYSFAGLANGSYSLRPQKTNCTLSPDVVNLNNLTSSRTQNFTGSGSGCATTGAAAKALILIDSRLYQQFTSTIDAYKSQVEARRGFAVDLRANATFDDWGHATVRQYVKDARTANPAIEGVLLIGNIKLPSFYKIRQDVADTRLMARYYEDLDGVFTRRYANGEIDPVCDSNATPDTKCVVSPRINGEGPNTTIPHDFDDTDFGPNRDPEIWAAFMPVGVAGSQNTYADFANQLRPYFQKLTQYYNRQLVTNGRYYHVSNGLNGATELVWNAYGKDKIDYYGKAGPGTPPQTDGACLVGSTNVCYVRWATESYSTYQQFSDAYGLLPWVGEGWQQSSIYINHMNANLYDVAEDIVHSTETSTIVSAADARNITKGALILGAGGCSVAGYVQPFAPAQSQVSTTVAPSDNVLVNFLYGSSRTLAALGTAPWRVEYPQTPTIYREMKTNGAYLGAAHLIRNKQLYAEAGTDKFALKAKGNEMLLGDPFIDLKP